MGKLFFWILGIFGIIYLFSSSGSLGEDKWLNITYYIVLLSFIGSGVLASYAGRKMEALKHAALWLGIFLFLLILYGFRHELGPIGERLESDLFPYKAMEGDGVLTFTRADDGHFYVEAEVNDVLIRFLVDTGATRVVLSPDDARTVGYDLNKLRFTQISYTANGKVSGAPVTLRTVRVGSYEIKTVPASVNGANMNSSLLGMTFLQKLKSYSVKGDILTLQP